MMKYFQWFVLHLKAVFTVYIDFSFSTWTLRGRCPGCIGPRSGWTASMTVHPHFKHWEYLYFGMHVVAGVCVLASGFGWRSTEWAYLRLCSAGRVEVVMRRTITSIIIAVDIIIIIITSISSMPHDVYITHCLAFLPGNQRTVLVVHAGSSRGVDRVSRPMCVHLSVMWKKNDLSYHHQT